MIIRMRRARLLISVYLVADTLRCKNMKTPAEDFSTNRTREWQKQAVTSYTHLECLGKLSHMDPSVCPNSQAHTVPFLQSGHQYHLFYSYVPHKTHMDFTAFGSPSLCQLGRTGWSLQLWEYSESPKHTGSLPTYISLPRKKKIPTHTFLYIHTLKLGWGFF